ncbi:MAG TPA: cupin domain-containing protein [Alphaproteobacteria bacterium]
MSAPSDTATLPDELLSKELRSFKKADMKNPVEKKASTFKLRAQMLKEGRTNTRLARADNMWAVLKVYASGGENGLHTHPSEDHTFLVLQGRAKFYDADGNSTELGKHEGIMLPAGTYYWFEATSTDEELILYRVGAGSFAGADPSHRLNIRGEDMPGDSEENKKTTPIFKDGVFFE